MRRAACLCPRCTAATVPLAAVESLPQQRFHSPLRASGLRMKQSLRRLGRSLNLSIHGHRAVRSAKNVRNEIVDRAFRIRGADAGVTLAKALIAREVRNVAFTIAYNNPWVIDLLTSGWRHHPNGMQLVVVDNSNDRSARASHDAICRQRGIAYLGLPRNLEWSPNRSHGIALNWVWFNVVRHATFEIVGFVDHDCIPIATIDIPARMADLSVYGLKGTSRTWPSAWNLWAGYCFLRPRAATGRTIDFKPRIEHGLDTGGGNWNGFYRQLDPTLIGDAKHAYVSIDIGDGSPAESYLLIDDSFLHLDGASYRKQLRDPVIRERLDAAIRDRYFSRSVL